MTTSTPADGLADRFERLVRDYPDELRQAKIAADKLRSDLTRPSQATAEPALIYRLSSRSSK